MYFIMNKVLILGAGLVAKPVIGYLLSNRINTLVASPMKDDADKMIGGNPLGTSLCWSMDDPVTLDRLVSDNDVTVSLLPYKFHTDVAKICLKNRKPLVTTSYIQPEMKLMADDVRDAGILFLNEIGLDPGIDHMSAMKVIDKIHGQGEKVEEFYSLCGALPAPEAAVNPLGYKFSWSPKGVVLASLNGASYLKKGRCITIEQANLFKERFSYTFPGVGEMEVYPNRDSISYIDIYNIPETRTIYRGTLRFRGWCETLDIMKQLNMLDGSVSDYSGKTYSDFLAERAGIKTGNIKTGLARKLGIPPDSTPLRAFEFLGFFSNKIMNYIKTSPFDITSDRMIELMSLSEDDRDMVVMQHIFLAVHPDGKKEVIKSSMLDYGSPSTNTAIARTVSLPAAIAVKMILQKRLDLAGIYRPVVPEIYNPVLDELKTLGIELKEEHGLPESEMII
jgi:saccharopine dehydrogenase-like NADP-dependent oxidoreductase